MKLEKIFEAKDGNLFTLSGEAVEKESVRAVNLSWKAVEPNEEGSYNEELLATLRLSLKANEEEKKFVYIVPIVDKDMTGEKYEQFTAAMKHSARRLKDCISIVGFALPKEIAEDEEKATFYIEELSAKHAQYVFFAQGKNEIAGVNIVRL